MIKIILLPSKFNLLNYTYKNEEDYFMSDPRKPPENQEDTRQTRVASSNLTSTVDKAIASIKEIIRNYEEMKKNNFENIRSTTGISREKKIKTAKKLNKFYKELIANIENKSQAQQAEFVSQQLKGIQYGLPKEELSANQRTLSDSIKKNLETLTTKNSSQSDIDKAINNSIKLIQDNLKLRHNPIWEQYKDLKTKNTNDFANLSVSDMEKIFANKKVRNHLLKHPERKERIFEIYNQKLDALAKDIYNVNSKVLANLNVEHLLKPPSNPEIIDTRAQYIAAFNLLKDKICMDILSTASTKQQTLALERWVGVMDRCYQLGDHNGCVSILSALNNFNIDRLKHLFTGLSSEAQETIKKYQETFPMGNLYLSRVLPQEQKRNIPIIPNIANHSAALESGKENEYSDLLSIQRKVLNPLSNMIEEMRDKQKKSHSTHQQTNDTTKAFISTTEVAEASKVIRIKEKQAQLKAQSSKIKNNLREIDINKDPKQAEKLTKQLEQISVELKKLDEDPTLQKQNKFEEQLEERSNTIKPRSNSKSIKPQNQEINHTNILNRGALSNLVDHKEKHLEDKSFLNNQSFTVLDSIIKEHIQKSKAIKEKYYIPLEKELEKLMGRANVNFNKPKSILDQKNINHLGQLLLNNPEIKKDLEKLQKDLIEAINKESYTNYKTELMIARSQSLSPQERSELEAKMRIANSNLLAKDKIEINRAEVLIQLLADGEEKRKELLNTEIKSPSRPKLADTLNEAKSIDKELNEFVNKIKNEPLSTSTQENVNIDFQKDDVENLKFDTRENLNLIKEGKDDLIKSGPREPELEDKKEDKKYEESLRKLSEDSEKLSNLFPQGREDTRSQAQARSVNPPPKPTAPKPLHILNETQSRPEIKNASSQVTTENLQTNAPKPNRKLNMDELRAAKPTEPPPQRPNLAGETMQNNIKGRMTSTATKETIVKPLSENLGKLKNQLAILNNDRNALETRTANALSLAGKNLENNQKLTDMAIEINGFYNLLRINHKEHTATNLTSEDIKKYQDIRLKGIEGTYEGYNTKIDNLLKAIKFVEDSTALSQTPTQTPIPPKPIVEPEPEIKQPKKIHEKTMDIFKKFAGFAGGKFKQGSKKLVAKMLRSKPVVDFNPVEEMLKEQRRISVEVKNLKEITNPNDTSKLNLQDLKGQAKTCLGRIEEIAKNTTVPGDKSRLRGASETLENMRKSLDQIEGKWQEKENKKVENGEGERKSRSP